MGFGRAFSNNGHPHLPVTEKCPNQMKNGPGNSVVIKFAKQTSCGTVSKPREKSKMAMSYRRKQLNTQLQEYIEVLGEAIWWHRMQEKPSAVGTQPRTYSAPQTT